MNVKHSNLAIYLSNWLSNYSPASHHCPSRFDPQWQYMMVTRLHRWTFSRIFGLFTLNRFQQNCIHCVGTCNMPTCTSSTEVLCLKIFHNCSPKHKNSMQYKKPHYKTAHIYNYNYEPQSQVYPVTPAPNKVNGSQLSKVSLNKH